MPTREDRLRSAPVGQFQQARHESQPFSRQPIHRFALVRRLGLFRQHPHLYQLRKPAGEDVGRHASVPREERAIGFLP